MDSRDLTKEQLDELKARLTGASCYLQALCERMVQAGFPYDDELRQKVTRAYDAIHSLSISIHYLACDRLANRPRDAKPGPTMAAYPVQAVMDPHAPLPTVERMELVEAPTPLEAVAQLARHGRLTTADTFFVRVALSVGSDGRPKEMISFPLSHSAIVPHPLTPNDHNPGMSGFPSEHQLPAESSKPMDAD